MEAVYEAHEKLIAERAWNYVERFGGDFDEVMSEAHWAFLRCLQTYDEARGCALSTWIYRDIDRHLLNWNKRKCSRTHQPLPEHVEDLPVGEKAQPVLERLRGDARVIAEMALKPEEVVVDLAIQRGGKPRNMASAVRTRLVELGWTMERIWGAWEEVRRVI